MSFERQFHDETQIIKEIFNVDVEIHKKESSLKKIELNRGKPTTIPVNSLEEYHKKTLLELKQNRVLLQEKLDYFIKEKIIKINAEISEHSKLIKIHGEQNEYSYCSGTSIQMRGIEEAKVNHLNQSLIFLAKIQKYIEQGHLSSTEGMTSLFKRNLTYKDDIIQKLDLLNKISYYNSGKNATSEEKDSAILILIDVISLAHIELKKDNQDADVKRKLYRGISNGLYHLTKIYLSSKENFKTHDFKKAIEKLYLLLCSINSDQNLKKNIPFFTQDNKDDTFNQLNLFIQFLENILEKKKEEKVTQTAATFPKEYIIGASIVGVTALYSLPIAGSLLFGASLVKVVGKLKDCCEPKKSPKPGKSS